MSAPEIVVSVSKHREGVAVNWARAVNEPGHPTRVVRHRKILPLDEPYTWAGALRVAAALLQREATRLGTAVPQSRAGVGAPSGATGANPQP